MHGSDNRDETQGNMKLDSNNWVGNYSDYLYSYAALMPYDDDLAKDLAQEDFLAALEAKTDYDCER
jgi:DNA-directed RNA polymerase specialized sigma24 family protein